MSDMLKKLSAKYPMQKKASGKIVTCPARLSFPHLFEKHQYKKSEPKFQAAFLFPKGADLSVLEAECEAVAAEKGFAGDPLEWIQDQAKKASKYEGYTPGAKFLNAKSGRPVPLKDAALAAITDRDELYPGAIVVASIQPYATDDGVFFSLEGVVKLADGERMGGGADTTEEDFSDIAVFEPAEDADDAI